MRWDRFNFIFKFVFIVGGSSLALISGLEIYPFSPYPMYSEKFEPKELIHYGILAVAKDTSEEFQFHIKSVFWPLAQAPLAEIFFRHHYRGGPTQVEKILTDLTTVFNERRGPYPPIQALRIYRYTSNWEEHRQRVLNDTSKSQIQLTFEKPELIFESKQESGGHP